MEIDIQLLPIAPDAEVLRKRSVVVLDILRATSVIVLALARGATEIIPVATVEEAFQLRGTFPHGTTLLGGERGSKKIEGFNLGNSPREYVNETVDGRRVILSTTNGTRAFHLVSSGEEIMVGSFYNISAVARKCLDAGRDLLVFASGDKGRLSLEDTVCGGMLIDLIVKMAKAPLTVTDAANTARILYQKFEGKVVEAFYLSRHGKDLVTLGLEEDLEYCSRTDLTDLVPIFRDGVIRGKP